ncbi:Uma2 family endonuclease [Herbihabitans rhizosphaerae]|uniref:Uma2 family endonuclease n=1 Tax=Herbihabitans rhizosphaerae TaxID=1872711 RepID=A0A4Q7L1C4_9PSEU|nr:Uma2 family endonuclease [Herbihabitans rhizosphaerae]RZS43309.1 Uma2 family endonuclease [Herbihabitans rhizosphaerae]
MTALPQPPHLLTVAEFAALGEDETVRYELQEGVLVMSPSPAPDHNIASGELFFQVRPQLPPDLRAIQDTDIDLELVPADDPGFARRPDLAVIRGSALDRVRNQGGLLCAADVVLAVEIVSPGSKRMDYVIKRGEYADAGIPHYWIIDLGEPASLATFHLADEFGYLEGGEHSGTFRAVEPFEITIDLDALN